jgi:site-specific DNA-methyltransferase (adenine-specific)
VGQIWGLELIDLIHGECLEKMAKLPDKSVDMVMCDLPYGTTQNKWDSVIDLSRLWTEYKRICSGVIVLTASQPFTSTVVSSNKEMFKYAWVWEKSAATGHLNAKRMPMKLHEDILVFGAGIYNPQDLKPLGKVVRRGNNGTNFGSSGAENFQEWTNYPRSILRFSHEGKSVHPTQKPVQLMEYLIKTYTNEGMTVLDNCMGSGTTGVACVNTNRNFIGIERDDSYFKICQERIQKATDERDAKELEDLFSEVTV